MSELVWCPACKGTKKILGMGMLEQSCEYCNAIGMVESKELANIPNSPQIITAKAIPKKKKNESSTTRA